jgi:hypothetical protein
MSMAAIANGGGVAAASAGGWIAALQSAGAAGLSFSTKFLLGSTAGGMFAMFNRKKPSEGTTEGKFSVHQYRPCKICLKVTLFSFF